MDAARAIVAADGYEALRVRALAQVAGVSSRTIYQNYASLDALLLAAVTDAWQSGNASLDALSRGDDCALERVNCVIAVTTEWMFANRRLAVGALRALLSARAGVAPHLDAWRNALHSVFLDAVRDDQATRRADEIAELLSSTWFTALVGWAAGVTTDAQLAAVMRCATQLLLDPAAAATLETKVL